MLVLLLIILRLVGFGSWEFRTRFATFSGAWHVILSLLSLVWPEDIFPPPCLVLCVIGSSKTLCMFYLGVKWLNPLSIGAAMMSIILTQRAEFY